MNANVFAHAPDIDLVFNGGVGNKGNVMEVFKIMLSEANASLAQALAEDVRCGNKCSSLALADAAAVLKSIEKRAVSLGYKIVSDA